MLVPQFSASAGTEFAAAADIRSITTPHFTIVYQKGDTDELAAEVAFIAEDVRSQVLDVLPFSDPGRYTLLLVNNYDYANGSASGFPLRVIRLFPTVPDPPIDGVSDISDAVGHSWLHDLLVHEYTHAVHLNRFTGWTQLWKVVFHSNPFHLIYPGWFVEGLAVAVESEKNDRGRSHTTTTQMFLRTALLSGTFLTPGSWGHVSSWPRGGSRYLYGGAFLHYVAQRFGTGALANIIDRTNAQIPFLDDIRSDAITDLLADLGRSPSSTREFRAGGLERGFYLATGHGLHELFEDWKQSLEQEVIHEQAAVYDTIPSQLTLLTSSSGNTRSPTASPDGTAIAYISGADSQLPSINLNFPQSQRIKTLIHRGDVSGNLSFSPDGQRIAYSRLLAHERPIDRYTVFGDLFELDIKTRRERRLTFGERLRDPAYSPDGSKIYAVKHGAGQTRLVVIKADGGDLTELFSPDIGIQFSTPRVSPNGKRLVLSVLIQRRYPEASEYAIGVVAANGSGFRTVSGPGVNRDPEWIDDDRIIYSSDRSGISNLYITSLVSGRTSALTNVFTGAFQPTVLRSPQCSIVFRHYSHRGFDIVRLIPDHVEASILLGYDSSRPLPDLSAAKKQAEQTARPLRSASVPILAAPSISPLRFDIKNPLTTITSPYPPSGSRYCAVRDLRLAYIEPVIGTNEGRIEEDFAGGYTVGGRFFVMDLINRHQLYVDLELGLANSLPSVTAWYSNSAFGFPITLYVNHDVAWNGGTPELPAWQRFFDENLSVRLPFQEGHHSASWVGSIGLFSDREFSSTVQSAGFSHSLYAAEQFSFISGYNNAWRFTQGHYLTFGAQQLHSLRTASGDGSEISHNVFASYLGRKSLGRGVIDLKTNAAASFGTDYPTLYIGGFFANWSLPGLGDASAIIGDYAGSATLAASHDIWQAQVAAGQVPWIFLDKLELVTTVGGATGYARHDPKPMFGSGASLGIKASVFSIRESLRFFPQISLGVDLKTGERTAFFTLDAWPTLYRRLLPIGLPLSIGDPMLPLASPDSSRRPTE